MSRSKFNFAWVFATLALLTYTYISFMGLIYSQLCSLGLSILIALAFTGIIVFLLNIMCKAKATRWLRLGIIGQISIGLIILVFLLVSSVFFTHFTRMIKEKESIIELYSETIDDARELDAKYREYVDQRCQSYKKAIGGLKVGTKGYADMVAKPLSLGLSQTSISEKYATRLKDFLLGDNIDALNEKRTIWLSESATTIWNINLPKNIQDVTSSVNSWLTNYGELSQMQYSQERNYPKFEDESFNQNADRLQLLCTTIVPPSFFAILLSIICCAIILLPWIVTSKDIAAIGDDNNYIVEMPEED